MLTLEEKFEENKKHFKEIKLQLIEDGHEGKYAAIYDNCVKEINPDRRMLLIRYSAPEYDGAFIGYISSERIRRFRSPRISRR